MRLWLLLLVQDNAPVSCLRSAPSRRLGAPGGRPARRCDAPGALWCQARHPAMAGTVRRSAGRCHLGGRSTRERPRPAQAILPAHPTVPCRLFPDRPRPCRLQRDDLHPKPLRVPDRRPAHTHRPVARGRVADAPDALPPLAALGGSRDTRLRSQPPPWPTRGPSTTSTHRVAAASAVSQKRAPLQ